MQEGDLVRLFSPETGLIDDLGPAVFIRRLIPSRDLPESHRFWRERTPTPIADAWHNEVLYGGSCHIILEKQLTLIPVECDEEGRSDKK